MSRASSAWFIISRFLKNEIHVVNECPKILWKVQGNLCVIISYINNEILYSIRIAIVLNPLNAILLE